jgi:hypothetical protein
MSYKNVSSQLCRPVSFVSNTNPTSSAAALLTNYHHSITGAVTSNGPSSAVVASTPAVSTANSASDAALPATPSSSPTHFSYRTLNGDHRPYFDSQYCTSSATHPHVALLSSQSTSYGSEATPPLSTLTHLSSDSSSAFDFPGNGEHGNVPSHSQPPPITHDLSYAQPPFTSGSSFEQLQSPSEATLLLNYRQLLDHQSLQSHSLTQPPQHYHLPVSQTASAAQHYHQYSCYPPTNSYQPTPSSSSADRRTSGSTYTTPTPAVYTPTQHLYQHVSSNEHLPVTWRRVHEHVRHLCAAHLTCVLLVLLPVLLAGLLIGAFVLQERSDKQHLHQYAIYAFVVFCVAFICPFALFFVLVLVNKAVRKYHKCFHPHLAAAAEFAEYGFNPYPHFAFTFPSSGYPIPANPLNPSAANYHWPIPISASYAREQFIADAAAVAAAAAAVGIQLGPYEAAQLLQAQRPISTLNVQQLSASTASGSGAGSAGTSGGPANGSAGRLSGSSVSSLLLGSDSSGRQRQRLIRQDAFECPPEYSHLPDGCAPYHAHDHPPSYELALLCPASKSLDEPSTGPAVVTAAAATKSDSQNAVTASGADPGSERKASLESNGSKRSGKTEEQTPPPPYDEKTMAIR